MVPSGPRPGAPRQQSGMEPPTWPGPTIVTFFPNIIPAATVSVPVPTPHRPMPGSFSRSTASSPMALPPSFAPGAASHSTTSQPVVMLQNFTPGPAPLSSMPTPIALPSSFTPGAASHASAPIPAVMPSSFDLGASSSSYRHTHNPALAPSHAHAAVMMPTLAEQHMMPTYVAGPNMGPRFNIMAPWIQGSIVHLLDVGAINPAFAMQAPVQQPYAHQVGITPHIFAAAVGQAPQTPATSSNFTYHMPSAQPWPRFAEQPPPPWLGQNGEQVEFSAMMQQHHASPRNATPSRRPASHSSSKQSSRRGTPHRRGTAVQLSAYLTRDSTTHREVDARTPSSLASSSEDLSDQENSQAATHLEAPVDPDKTPTASHVVPAMTTEDSQSINQPINQTNSEPVSQQTSETADEQAEVQISAETPSPVRISANPVRLYVQGLPYRPTEDKVKELIKDIFKDCHVVKIEVGRKTPSAKLKKSPDGYAWVTVASPKDAQHALDTLNGNKTGASQKMLIMPSQDQNEESWAADDGEVQSKT